MTCPTFTTMLHQETAMNLHCTHIFYVKIKKQFLTLQKQDKHNDKKHRMPF